MIIDMVSFLGANLLLLRWLRAGGAVIRLWEEKPVQDIRRRIESPPLRPRAALGSPVVAENRRFMPKLGGVARQFWGEWARSGSHAAAGALRNTSLGGCPAGTAVRHTIGAATKVDTTRSTTRQSSSRRKELGEREVSMGSESLNSEGWRFSVQREGEQLTVSLICS